MPHLGVGDRVKETTTTTGTGTINLDGASQGYQTFVAGIGNGHETYYSISNRDADEWEVGYGTITDSTPDTLSRTTVISSSNGGALVNFSAGTKDVICTLPSDRSFVIDDEANVSVSANVTATSFDGSGVALTALNASNVSSGTLADARLTGNVVLTSGATFTGNVSLGDNDYLRFGVGNDLQIHHDGSDSFIEESGGGNLYLKSNGNQIQFLDSTNGVGFSVDLDGATSLRHNTSQKLVTSATGVTITGTASATTFSGSGASLTTLNASNVSSGTLDNARLSGDVVLTSGATFTGNVAFGDLDYVLFGATGEYQIYHDHANGVSNIKDVDAGATINIEADTVRITGTPNVNSAYTLPTSDGTSGQVLTTNGSGALAFQTPTVGDITGVTAGSGLTGGGTSGDVTLNVGAGTGVTVNADDIAIGQDVATSASPTFAGLTSTGDLTVDTNTLYVDSTNNRVGVGTDSPTEALDVVGEIKSSDYLTAKGLRIGLDNNKDINAENNSLRLNAGEFYFKRNSDALEYLRLQGTNVVVNELSNDLDFRVESNNNTHALFVDGGNDMLTIGGTGEGQADSFTFNYGDTGGAYLNFNMDGRASAVTGVNGAYIYSGQGATGDFLAGSLILQSRSDNDRNIQFVTGSTPTIRMIVDGSGNVLVGKTTTDFGTAGVLASSTGSYNGTRSGKPMSLNRLGSDGDILEFYKDSTTVGSIGTLSGDLAIGTGDVTLWFNDGGNNILPRGTSFGANDNVIDLGNGSNRFKDAFFGGTVNATRIESGVNSNFDDTLKVTSTGGFGFTQGDIRISSATTDGPSGRGQGIFMFNEGYDRTFYAGTLYGNQAYGIGSVSNTGLDTSAANATNSYVEFYSSSTGTVFNERSVDRDFRVESNNNSSMLYVDGGNDEVVIGASSSAYAGSNDLMLAIRNGSGPNINFFSDVSGGNALTSGIKTTTYGASKYAGFQPSSLTGVFTNSSAASQLYLMGNSFVFSSISADPSENASVTTTTDVAINSGETVFNQSSIDKDFRVESNNYTHALFVDGGTDRVGINESSPGAPLHVTDSDNTLAYFVSTDANANIRFSDSSSSTIGATGIGAKGNDLTILSGGADRITLDSSGHFLPAVTNTQDIGSASLQFRRIYLGSAAVIQEQTLTDGATIAWDVSAKAVAKVTLGGNRTLSAPNSPIGNGQFISLLVIQDGTGSRTLSWNAAYEFKDDTAPTLTTTANKADLFTFRYNGSKWLEVGRNTNLSIS